MRKVKVLRDEAGVSVELGSFFTWWEVGKDENDTLRTSVCIDGTDPCRGAITPKQLRKIAKTLRALADEVDPPAPKTTYYEATCSLFYRQRPGALLELWEPGRGWIRSGYDTIDEQTRDNGEHDSWPITADELPAGAR